MQLHASFLPYNQSQIAVASLLLGIQLTELKDNNLLNETNFDTTEALEASKLVWN